MGKKKQTIEGSFDKAKVAASAKWRKEKGIKLKTTVDPNNERSFTKITIIAPDDYIIGQCMNRLQN